MMLDENREIFEMVLVMFEVFCGLVSIVNLIVISYDCYYFVIKLLYYIVNIIYRKVFFFIVCIWGYVFIVVFL